MENISFVPFIWEVVSIVVGAHVYNAEDLGFEACSFVVPDVSGEEVKGGGEKKQSHYLNKP